jgi:DNA polymerase-3 subunit delta
VYTIDQIKKDVKEGKIKSLYVLDGDESFYTDDITDFLENNILPEDQRSFDQTVLYGKDVDEITILNTVTQYPMMAPKTVVIVREAQFLKDLNVFKNYLEKAPSHSVLILALKGKTLDKRTGFGQKAAKEAVYFSGKKIREDEVPEWINNHLKKDGFKAENNAIQLMAEYLGNDLGHIDNELTKLKLILKKGDLINSHHVEEYIGISREYNVFELNKHLGNRQHEKVMRIVRYFQRNPKAAPFELVIGTLYRYFNQLYLLHHVPNHSDAEKAKTLGILPFFLRDYNVAKNNYPLHLVERNLQLLLTYDLRNKGYNEGFNNPTELLKEMVLKLMEH